MKHRDSEKCKKQCRLKDVEMIDDDRKTPTKVPRAKRGGFINYFLYYRIISKLKRERGMTFILKFTVFMQYPEITEGFAPQCI